MSKFQVGDKVRHINNGWLAEVIAVDDNRGKSLLSFNRSDEAWSVDDALELADPHVPDVDGNPIRAGQLVEDPDGEFARVERFYEHETELTERCMWARLSTTAARPAHKLRVLTADDLFCAPEPDTRDVTLRVTVVMHRQERDAMAAEAVQRMLENRRWTVRSVEVVADGGHDDE